MKRAKKWRTAKPAREHRRQDRVLRMVRRALAMPGTEFVDPLPGAIQTAPSEKHWAVEHCYFTDEHGKTTRYTRKLT